LDLGDIDFAGFLFPGVVITITEVIILRSPGAIVIRLTVEKKGDETGQWPQGVVGTLSYEKDWGALGTFSTEPLRGTKILWAWLEFCHPSRGTT